MYFWIVHTFLPYVFKVERSPVANNQSSIETVLKRKQVLPIIPSSDEMCYTNHPL